MNTRYPQENSKDPALVKDCLQQGALKQIVQKARLLMALNEKLLEALEPDIRAHCQVMNIEGTTLSIGVNNAAWATRLRYQSKDLLKHLKQNPELAGVTVLNVKVLL